VGGGLWSTEGVVPLSFTFDTPGLLARSVSDLAYGFAALDPAEIDPSAFIARGGALDLTGIGVGDPSCGATAILGSPKPCRKQSTLSFAPAPSRGISPCRRWRRRMACFSRADSARSSSAVF
jgi:hypothetical protein